MLAGPGAATQALYGVELADFDHPHAEASVDGQIIPRQDLPVSRAEADFEPLGSGENLIDESLFDE